jgi:hypothetical protein
VLALKEALVGAARFRTRPTWEALSRTAGSDLLGLSVPHRVGLLVAVERTADGEGSPLLSALIRTGESDPPPYVGDVVAAVGCGAPATAAVLKRWCQCEADRAFAVHGVPSRTPPPRLPLTPDGRLAAQQSAEPLSATPSFMSRAARFRSPRPGGSRRTSPVFPCSVTRRFGTLCAVHGRDADPDPGMPQLSWRGRKRH